MGPLFRSIRVFSSASVLSSPGKTPYPLPQNFSPFCPSLLPPCPKVAYFLDADNMKPTTALELSRLLDPFRSRLKVAMAFGNIQTFQKDKYRELMKADDAFHIVETPVTNDAADLQLISAATAVIDEAMDSGTPTDYCIVIASHDAGFSNTFAYARSKGLQTLYIANYSDFRGVLDNVRKHKSCLAAHQTLVWGRDVSLGNLAVEGPEVKGDARYERQYQVLYRPPSNDETAIAAMKNMAKSMATVAKQKREEEKKLKDEARKAAEQAKAEKRKAAKAEDARKKEEKREKKKKEKEERRLAAQAIIAKAMAQGPETGASTTTTTFPASSPPPAATTGLDTDPAVVQQQKEWETAAAAAAAAAANGSQGILGSVLPNAATSNVEAAASVVEAAALMATEHARAASVRAQAAAAAATKAAKDAKAAAEAAHKLAAALKKLKKKVAASMATQGGGPGAGARKAQDVAIGSAAAA